METRISFEKITPGILKGMQQVESTIGRAGIDPKLLELVRHRVSQINRCAFCLDMHHKNALELGESELRLHSLPAWRECPYYSDAERAALALAEELTQPGPHGIPDEMFSEVAGYFDEAQIVALTACITQINSWNRLNLVFRPEPGKYEVGQFARAV